MILSAVKGEVSIVWLVLRCWAEMRIWCHFLSGRVKSKVILKKFIDKQRLKTANISLLVLIQSTCQTGAQTDPYHLHEWNETLKIKQSCKEEWLFNSMWNVSHQGHLRWREGRRWRRGRSYGRFTFFFHKCRIGLNTSRSQWKNTHSLKQLARRGEHFISVCLNSTWASKEGKGKLRP